MFRKTPILLAAGALLSATFLAAGCGSTDCSFTATCAGDGPPGQDGGADGSDGMVVIPKNCDLKKSPKDSPDCVDDGVGVFVDANGKADGAGTKVDPVSKIATAIDKAVSTKRPRVYICDGMYAEPIKLTSAVSVYGGFDCKWNNTGVKPKVVPPTEAAIQVKGVSDAVVIQDLAATGNSNPADKGSSAIGAFIVQSKVTFKNVALSAGSGQPGAKGGSQSNYLTPAKSGTIAVGMSGGMETTCQCSDKSSSTGGHGTDGDGTNQTAGTSVPVIDNPNGGSNNLTTCSIGGTGMNGAAEGTTDPVSAPGQIVATGWDVTKIGPAGKNGHPGQGGGGGGAKTTPKAAGGGGGCGGCGGAGGLAGANAGASIGLLSFGSTIACQSSTISAGAGGKGGDGGDAQPGQDGALGGVGASCDGGPGGTGAGGSGGPGGAGGDSIGVAWTGAVDPVLAGTVAKAGTAGPPGAGGTAGGGAGNAGPTGTIGTPGRVLPTYHQQ